MESNYRNRDFEEFVKQNADQYRMFPSENVWKSINSTLHTRRKWYGFGLAFLLLLTGTAVTWVMVSYPASKNQVAAATTPIDNKQEAPHVKKPFSVSTPIVIENATTLATTPFNTISTNDKSSSLEVEVENSSIATNQVVAPQALIDQEQEQKLTAFITTEQPSVPAAKIERPLVLAEDIQKNSNGNGTGVYTPEVLITPSPDAIAAPENTTENKSAIPKTDLYTASIYPLTIESVLNTYHQKKSKQISWQLFVTPTVSYRKLDENKSFNEPFDNTARITYPFASLTDVNKAVTHKPDMGLQLGVSAGYPVTRNIKIRGGFQFNINRYDIKAFPFNPEIATINLSAANGINSVSTWTPYRNYGGFRSDWLKNFYFSISAPIGVEVKLIGNNKTSFGIAGTLQPTYILKDRAYLISTDYKNYAEVPSLIRHVNLNTGFETFVNYTNGKTRWQIGPQVRYQVLSSFHNKYPVKENLFDFGLKIGVSLNN